MMANNFLVKYILPKLYYYVLLINSLKGIYLVSLYFYEKIILEADLIRLNLLLPSEIFSILDF
jgi:hypothetical protein